MVLGFGSGDPRTQDIKKRKKELRKLVKGKKYEQALECGLDLLKVDPYENDILFIVGSIYYVNGSYRKAVSYLGRSLKIATYDVESLILKAHSHIKLGQPEMAKDCVRLIREVDPKNREAERILSMAG